MHQPVLLLSEEVNFHASGWTMWTARFLLLKPPARLTATKGGNKPAAGKKKKKKYQKKKKKKVKKHRGERDTEKTLELRPQEHYWKRQKRGR